MSGQILGCAGNLRVQYVEMHRLDDHEDNHIPRVLRIHQQGNHFYSNYRNNIKDDFCITKHQIKIIFF